MWQRHIKARVQAALGDTPCVFIAGPRQSGKSTLVRALSGNKRRYLTFDDPTLVAAAQADPVGFVSGLRDDVALDEVQRAPQLYVPLKAEIDRARRPGRFLLTGSANAMMLPALADALVGRMEIATLYPLSEAEIEGRQQQIDAWFSREALRVPGPPSWQERALRGGFPEVRARKTAARRRAWFESYAATVLLRDVRELAAIERASALPRLFSIVAARATGLVNHADLARDSGLSASSLSRYLALLETVFLLETTPPWFANLGKRLVKSPRLYVVDAGLLCHALGIHDIRTLQAAPQRGAILQDFCVMEIRKQAEVSKTRPRLLHFRSHDGKEVDLVLEDARGRLIGIEIKSSATLGTKDFAGLQALRQLAKEKFLRGLVLYAGERRVPVDASIEAVPISILWSGGR